MTVQKIKSGRVLRTTANEFIGESGTIFYNESLGDLRLSNGVTPGGVPLIIAGSGTGSNYVLPIASTVTLGGVKVGNNLSISIDGRLDASLIGGIDGGLPNSVYGGINAIDGGGI
jgi:hypothetical protein